MNVLKLTPNPSGAYPPIQTTSFVPEGWAVVPDEVGTQVFQQYNGFVCVTVEDGVVTSILPDAAAWERWRAALPDPEPEQPTDLERLEAQVAYTAMMTDTLLEV